MLRVENITKKYGDKVVVNNLSFELQRGEVLGFLGANGAGKSTTMNIITGYIGASSGRVLIDGHDSVDEVNKVKGLIGYLPENPPVYLDMTVEEYLKFVCELKRVKKTEIHNVLEEIMDSVNIVEVRGRLIKNLSKGYKQRVGIAQAIIGDPEIVIFDEPTVGLDPKEIVEIRNLIKKIGKEKTVIISSHILSEVEEVCDKLLIINKGEFVAIGTKEELKKKLSSSNKIFLRVKGEKKSILEVLNTIDGINSINELKSIEENSYDFNLELEENKDPREDIFFKLADKKLPIMIMNTENLDLENIFLKITE
ncbi:ABC-2 type transport system ATP-binding protein [Clostridium collagenovorans DSM 3089]|uniref:ABC-2 type transport system ATP-binding protein n=1 Tax=Clostridium collagenovorans DSM 3089 TaxID=1121306 RepID=A0A1M5V3Z7_9CLOT|nr:ABC transporter ATP-binding protein [Clostridium collagenovorans]SHH69997.1 ABC-2 type transport system ATP-binding protein [Clostridium collagenovorans DSM 3089]